MALVFGRRRRNKRHPPEPEIRNRLYLRELRFRLRFVDERAFSRDGSNFYAYAIVQTRTLLCNRHRLIERDLVLFHPTRVLARKNLELDIEVVAALRKQGVDAVCVITGARDPHRPESDGYAATVRALVICASPSWLTCAAAERGATFLARRQRGRRDSPPSA